MMTADEARKVMEMASETLVKEKCEKISNWIRETAEKGMDSICIAGILEHEVRKLLEGAGYRVVLNADNNNERNTIISWKTDERRAYLVHMVAR